MARMTQGDLNRIGQCRRQHNKLGFGYQLSYVKMMNRFPAGSMGPKVEAMMQFFKATGNRGVICQLADVEKAIAGMAGTEIIK